MSNIKQEYSHTLKFLTELGPELDSCKSNLQALEVIKFPARIS